MADIAAAASAAARSAVAAAVEEALSRLRPPTPTLDELALLLAQNHSTAPDQLASVGADVGDSDSESDADDRSEEEPDHDRAEEEEEEIREGRARTTDAARAATGGVTAQRDDNRATPTRAVTTAGRRRGVTQRETERENGARTPELEELLAEGMHLGPDGRPKPLPPLPPEARAEEAAGGAIKDLHAVPRGVSSGSSNSRSNTSSSRRRPYWSLEDALHNVLRHMLEVVQRSAATMGAADVSAEAIAGTRQGNGEAGGKRQGKVQNSRVSKCIWPAKTEEYGAEVYRETGTCRYEEMEKT